MAESGLPGVRLTRSRLEAVARIRVPDGQWAADVIDLSLSGALVVRPVDFGLAPDSMASIEFSCTEMAALRVQARLVRVDPHQLAFSFEGLGPSQQQDLRDLIDRRGLPKDGVS